MGTTPLHTLSEHVAYIASAQTWIEGKALEQLQQLGSLPHVQKVVGMPDLHPGNGYPIGSAFFSTGHVYPSQIGGDIGCGMAFLQTDLAANKYGLDKLQKRLGNIDGPLDEAERSWLPDAWQGHAYAGALGTIGLGNHFAELQSCDRIEDEAAAAAIGLKAKALFLLVHSGSRGFGGQIGRDHVAEFGGVGLSQDSLAAQAYVRQHDEALAYARCNRDLIGQRILQRLGTTATRLLDVEHNMIEARRIDGVDGWLHRKGACPADQGLVILPGSRGDYSYLVQPIPSVVSLYSLAHGAGRKWQRSDCKGKLAQRYDHAALLQNRFKGRVICADKALVYEEAPQAYKSIDTIIESLLGLDLIMVVARFKPLLTYKTAGGTRSCG